MNKTYKNTQKNVLTSHSGGWRASWLAYGLSLFVTLACFMSAKAQWTNVGTAGFSAGYSEFQSLKMHPFTGEPYVAYQDEVNNSACTVMRFTSGAWQVVGTTGFSAGYIDFLSLAFHPTTGEPYVAYRDGANGNGATVMRFNGTNWVLVGTAGFSAADINNLSLAFHPTAYEPYLAYGDGGSGYKTTVMRFNGTSWVNVGAAGFSVKDTYNQSLAFHPTTGEPYVAYADPGPSGSNYKTYVMRFTSGAWAVVGTAGFSAGQALYQSLAFHPTTLEPYVAYQDAASSLKTTVMRFTSGAWAVVGAVGFSAGQATYQSLAFHPSTSEPYVAYQDAASSLKTTVMRFTGGAWANVGTAGFSAGGSEYQNLAFHPTTFEPYVAYKDVQNTDKTTVMKFTSPSSPEINLQGNGVNIPKGDVTPLLTDHTDFGTTGISTSIVRTFTIQNTGTSTLNVTSINNTNLTDFTVGGLTLPTTITAGSSKTFTVTFNSNSVGTKTATITINNNDADEALYDFAITGRVINATPSGVRGNMLSLDGTDDHIAVTHNASLNIGTGQLTLSAWVRRSSVGTFDNILMKGAYGYGFIIDDNNRLGYWSEFNYTNCFNSGSNTIPANTWTHVAVVVSAGTSTTLYINGVNVGTSTNAAHTVINNNTSALAFGVQDITSCNCNRFGGNIDEVQVWNTARTQAQIRESMHLTLAGTESGLVGGAFGICPPFQTIVTVLVIFRC